jgi:phenylacetate-CoA ligase
LVSTGLLNADMPLIRYEVGDRVLLAAPGAQCPCGRTLPILESVDGRNDDVIVTPDGRRIGRLDPVFKGGLPISEAQIVQESVGCLRVLLVPALGYHPDHARLVEERLRDRVGNMEIIVEQHKTLPRSANGKLRAVVSVVSPQSSVASCISKLGEFLEV